MQKLFFVSLALGASNEAYKQYEVNPTPLTK